MIVSIVQNPIFPASKHVFFPEVATALVLQTQVPKLCTDLDLSLLYILKLGTYSKFAWNNNFLALGVCFPQPCSSAGCRFAASRSTLLNYRRIVLFPEQKKSMDCVKNWIPLRIRVRLKNTQPHHNHLGPNNLSRTGGPDKTFPFDHFGHTEINNSTSYFVAKLRNKTSTA